MRIFNRGIPTIIDVDKLLTEIGVPLIGQVVTYAEISGVTGLKKGTNRFSSVLCAWRNKLDRENNIIFRAVPSVGLEAVDGHGRVDVAAKRYKHGFKSIAKSATIAARTDRDGLTVEEKKTLDHMVKFGAHIRLAEATVAKSLSDFS